jgi:excisionase family DNA binding protein
MKPPPPKRPKPRLPEAARQAARSLSGVLRSRSSAPITVRASVEGAKAAADVPREAFRIFLELLGHLANGDRVVLTPLQTELTTQEAANLMKVSRPYLVQLLENGRIPHRKVGTHRRLRAGDLLKVIERDRKRRRAVLDALAAEARKGRLGN